MNKINHFNVRRGRDELFGSFALTLTLTSALAFSISARAANVDFSDGGSHIINDTTYMDDTITVSNATTLTINSGAVLGGTGNFSGQITVKDSSILIINGGTFGGTGADSGNIYAIQNSNLSINGGNFGASGGLSGDIYTSGTSVTAISGGNFGGSTQFSGAIIPGGTSSVSISGGNFSAGTGVSSGSIQLVSGSGATVAFEAASFNQSFFDTTAGGVLGATFCSQAAQNIVVAVNKSATPTLTLDTVVCNVAPVAKCKSVTVPSGVTCTAPASIDDGSFDANPLDTLTYTQTPSGPYNIGLHTVSLFVTDNHGAQSSTCSATVTVTDNSTPVFNACPSDQSVNATSPLGAIASFATPPATDSCALVTPLVSCSPLSGSLFPIATTPVSCSASEGIHTGYCQFNIVVKGAKDQVNDLIGHLSALSGVNGLVKLTLKTIAYAAQATLATNHASTACQLLKGFISYTTWAASKNLLPSASASSLVVDATRIRAVIGCSP